MKEDKPKDRFVHGAQPVNRRTTKAAPPAPSRPLQALRARKALARGQLGLPLAVASARPAAQDRRSALPAKTIGLVVVVVGLIPLAVLAAPVLMKIGFGTASAAVLGSAWWTRRRTTRALPGAESGLTPPAVDPATLRQLDALMEAVAPELPQDAMAALLGLKDTLARVLQVMPRDAFTMDDRLYVAECVRRYLPDSIEAYLHLPAAGRDAPLEGGRSGTEVFIAQLQLLQRELELRERKGASAAGDRLMQQQRFLEAKSRE